VLALVTALLLSQTADAGVLAPCAQGEELIAACTLAGSVPRRLEVCTKAGLPVVRLQRDGRVELELSNPKRKAYRLRYTSSSPIDHEYVLRFQAGSRAVEVVSDVVDQPGFLTVTSGKKVERYTCQRAGEEASSWSSLECAVPTIRDVTPASPGLPNPFTAGARCGD
jgi:hypothetical protein